jgi:Tfp pilus assembly protein PilN
VTHTILSLRSTGRNRWLGHDTRAALQVLGISVGTFALLCLAAVIAFDIQLNVRLEGSRDAGTQMQERFQRASAPRTVSRPLKKEQLSGLNAVVRQLNTPWMDVFDILERRTPANVALVSIEPDGRRSIVRVQAEARSIDELLAYAETLERDAAVTRVVLLRHETNDRDENHPAQLSFEVSLNPNAAAYSLEAHR